MKKYSLRLLFIFQLFFCLSSYIQAGNDDAIPNPPSPPKLVNDFAGILSAEQVSVLENKLAGFNKATSNQIAIVIINDLGGYEPNEFSTKLGRKWGIGQEKLRNGILILIKPKTASEKGQAYIATGKGLEGAIPDAACLEIVNNEMKPNFRQNKYYEGLDAATTVLMALAKGEYNYATYSKKPNDSFTLVLIIVIVLVMAFFIYSRKNRSYTMNRDGYTPSIWPFFLGGFLGGGNDRSDNGGSGNDGGGFGGFGGGDFGGGGAGGSW